MTKLPLLILDQWASHAVQAGTSKNWLYDLLGNHFSARVINADNGITDKTARISCLLKAMITRPMDFRKEYYRQLEWEAKHTNSFKARTKRFQSAIDRCGEPGAAIFQVGCLFGPVQTKEGRIFSYHDQTVAMVERYWTDWLPRNFDSFKDQFYELEAESLHSKDVIFTYSEFTRNSMISDYGIPPERVVVAPTACKLAYPDEKDALKDRAPKLLFASTDFYRKGGDIVFKAFDGLRQIRPDLELVLVGGAPTTPLPEGARYLGLLPHSRLREEYLTSSLLLHPARYDAYPNVLKEAQACGLPAIASDSAGIPEIVTDGETGIIVKDIRPDALANSIEKVLGDQEALKAMQGNCLRKRDHFKPEVCAKRITDVMIKTMKA